MGARWEDTLDAMLDLYTWWGSEQGQDFGRGYARSIHDELDALVKEEGIEPVHPWTHLADQERAMLLRADPFYVDPDMMTLYEAAAAKFQPEPLQRTDLLTPYGFVLLPRPLVIKDVHGGDITYRAFGWRSVTVTAKVGTHESSTPGIIVSLYHDRRDHDDYSMPKAERAMTQPLTLTHIMPWVFGWDLPSMDTFQGTLTKTGDPTVFLVDDPQVVFRQVQCLWRLMAQSIALKVETRASAPFRKRWERQQLEAKPITVVRLRRPDYYPHENGEHHDVAWTHRWLVSGHWRNQPFKSLGIHRQIWINPYIKGPEDKPLQMRKFRVFEFVR